MNKRTKKVKSPVQGKVARIPVVIQLEALECGAACLTMILAYYGKWVPLEQVRSDCGVSRDGSNARNILLAARNYGLNADAYKAEPEDVKKFAKFPCIVHWEFNHFVVLNGFRNGKVYLNDPARGKIAISEEAFDEGFTGVFLMFEPSEDFVPSGSKKSTLDFARKRLTGAKSALLFMMLLSVIAAVFGLINPAMGRVFVDRLLVGRNPEWTVPFLIILSALAVVQLTVSWIQAIYSLRIQGKLAVVGNMTFMWKLLRLPMDFFSQRMSGDLLQRQNTNATVAGTLVNTFAPLLLNSCMMIIYLVVMLRQSPLLTLVGLIALVCNLLNSIVTSGKRVNITRVQQRDSGRLASLTMTGMQMIETIKASGSENGYFRNWAGLQAAVNKQQISYERLNAFFGMVPLIMSEASNTIILVLGVYLVIRGKFTPGMIMAFQSYLSSFMSPAVSLIGAGQMIQEMRTDMERMEEVMEYADAPAVREEPFREDLEYNKLRGEIEIRNLSFGYARLKPPLIRDFNMHIKPGSKVAFVGASGCGKSTLAKLISGLYEPWTGEILFDGRPFHEIDRSVFTSSLAVVDQDITLFEDTIGQNIRLWDDTIEEFEVILAARDAQIHDDIMQREGGYDGMLTEGGSDLSGGQRQRLELARVLAQDPTIVVLDEATSALDAQTEYKVIQAVAARGITCIIIAHRLSTIRDCDEIVVLDQGEVVERGTHEELYARGGIYTALVTNE